MRPPGVTRLELEAYMGCLSLIALNLFIRALGSN